MAPNIIRKVHPLHPLVTTLLVIFVGFGHAKIGLKMPAPDAQANYEGGVVVTAGYPFTDRTQTFGMKILPYLPYDNADHTLSLLGSILYNCGGHDGNEHQMKECYVLDTQYAEPVWTLRFDLPVSMSYHTASVVSNHIWFIYENALYDFDSEKEEFTTFPLPYIVTDYQCAVSNGSHVHVFGVGNNRNEIWVNRYDYDPSDWMKVPVTTIPRRDSACLLLNDQVYITGGFNEDGYESVGSTLEIFDAKEHSLATGAFMPGQRHAHKMFLLDGSPAVIGGQFEYDNKESDYYDSTFVYDISSNEWASDSTTKLSGPRAHFGLVQFPLP